MERRIIIDESMPQDSSRYRFFIYEVIEQGEVIWILRTL